MHISKQHHVAALCAPYQWIALHGSSWPSVKRGLITVVPVIVLILVAAFGLDARADVIIRHAPLSAKSLLTNPAVTLLVEVPFWLTVSCFLIVTNAVAFGIFAWDKWCARRGRWRVSENNLLLIVIIGGSVGAILAQQWFRHKTHKEPFRTILYGIAVLQALVLLAMLYSPAWQIIERFGNNFL